MFYNHSPPRPHQRQQETNSMNILISPFEPEQYQLQYPSGPQQFEYNDMISTQPLDDIDILDENTTHTMANNIPLYSQSPLPQLDMMNNEFISRSPESSSSAESNSVSPPHQYYHSSSTADYSDYSDFGCTSKSTPLQFLPSQQLQLASQYNHHPAAKRSASVPPHFHKFKPRQQDSIYNEFPIVTPTLHHQLSAKALPIQIQRVNNSHHQSNRAINIESHRRRLDEKLEKVNFDDITVAELKEILRERGLFATGRKAELIDRLKEEYKSLIKRRGPSILLPTASVVTIGSSAPTHQQQQPLHRRVANLNLADASPVIANRQQRHYFPYSPPPTRHASITLSHGHRLASSLPDSHTQSYLNDQFIMKKKPSSCLRKSIQEDVQLQQRDWSQQQYFSEESTEFIGDIWDDQTLQNFLNQI